MYGNNPCCQFIFYYFGLQEKEESILWFFCINDSIKAAQDNLTLMQKNIQNTGPDQSYVQRYLYSGGLGVLNTSMDSVMTTQSGSLFHSLIALIDSSKSSAGCHS